MNLNQLFCEMIQYYRNDPKRIQHFTKVHSYAKLIGELSGMQGGRTADTRGGCLCT